MSGMAVSKSRVRGGRYLVLLFIGSLAMVFSTFDDRLTDDVLQCNVTFFNRMY